MQNAKFRGFMLAVVMMTACSARAADLAGRYMGEEDPTLSLMLEESSGGAITGTLAEPGTSMRLTGRRQGTGFSGTVGPAGQTLPFTATVQGEHVILAIGGEKMTFKRVAAAPGTAASGGVAPAKTAPDAGKRKVVINGKRLSDEELARTELQYRIRIPDADYWYDRVLGAWGARGGPTMGFITPGLDLGGPLPADASGGGTRVFVNGRALHPYDLAALQQITGPILPGRYFITAQGLAGYEGGPPLWNLAAMAAQAQGTSGGSNTWQSRVTGASGFSDGTTGAVFLPNGGIVSTGQ